MYTNMKLPKLKMQIFTWIVYNQNAALLFLRNKWDPTTYNNVWNSYLDSDEFPTDFYSFLVYMKK